MDNNKVISLLKPLFKKSWVVVNALLLLSVGTTHAIKNRSEHKNKPSLELAASCVPSASASLSPAVRAQIATLLAWQPSTKGLCRGHFRQEKSEFFTRDLHKANEIKLSADSASLIASGRSTLKGHVEVREIGRMLEAETAYVYRKDNQLDKVELIGQVVLREPGRLLRANKAVIYHQQQRGTLSQALYRIALNNVGALHLPSGGASSAWGRAESISRDPEGNYSLQQASYSTCSPLSRGWVLHANEIQFNKKKGKGSAKHAVLKLADVPVFYWPYVSFPLEKKRKTGFLMPELQYDFSSASLFDSSAQSGLVLTAPFYWNIAPNYDLTLYPRWYQTRGAQLGAEFRYLWPYYNGTWAGAFLPQDENYQQFLAQRQLSGMESRYHYRINHHQQLGSNWQANLDIQRVSDDYYIQDFSPHLTEQVPNQLLGLGELNYSDSHWFFNARVQDFQTLNPVNQSVTLPIYRLSPQLELNGLYALSKHWQFELDSQLTNFSWPGANHLTTPEGLRLHLNPKFNGFYQGDTVYLKPSLSVQETYYDLRHYQGTARSFQRLLPQVSLESGVFFDRQLNWFGQAYHQVLAPKLYYLYVPYQNQRAIPLFDTVPYLFSFGQLFRHNRFAGLDRIADANQLSFSLSSHWSPLAGNGGGELSLRLGQAIYFQPRRVNYCYATGVSACQAERNAVGRVSSSNRLSPLAGQLDYQLSQSWSVNGQIAWDLGERQVNNAVLQAHYQRPDNHILNVSYGFLSDADTLTLPGLATRITNLHQIRLSYAWPFTDHWQGIGAWNYNISHGFAMNYLLGMQYDSCCYAWRLLGGRAYQSLTTQGAPVYTNTLYFQFLLKGLGALATQQAKTVITSNVPGYQDSFK